MSWGVISIQQSCSVMSTTHRIPSSIRQHCCSFVPPNTSLFSSNLSHGLLKLPTLDLKCKSTSGGDSGQNESKEVLDAFFLGKALGEALNERLESAVGEFLSLIGRFQAEQQKQLFEFQDEVLEKARRAKEQASREAAEARGGQVSTVNGVPKTTSSVSDSVTSTVVSSSVSKLTYEDPLIGLFKD